MQSPLERVTTWDEYWDMPAHLRNIELNPEYFCKCGVELSDGNADHACMRDCKYCYKVLQHTAPAEFCNQNCQALYIKRSYRIGGDAFKDERHEFKGK